jgi:hypothetical protein
LGDQFFVDFLHDSAASRGVDRLVFYRLGLLLV